MIEYALLSNGKGVAIKRAPQLVEGDISLRFQNPPDFGYVAASKGDKVIYADLVKGECKIHSTFLDGKLGITVASRTYDQKWACEGLSVQSIGGNKLVSVDDGDLPEKVARLEQAVDILARDNVSNKALTESLLDSVSELKLHLGDHDVEIASLIKAYNNPMG